MSRWADTFAALSRGHDTLDTMRHTGSIAPLCRTVSTVSHPPSTGESAAEAAPAAGPEINPDESASPWIEAGPRSWAERFARLHPDRPRANVPSRRWAQFIADGSLFLDSPFCAVAAALGWGPLDLFGCDRDRPFARIDQAGLLWLLNGGKLVALTEGTAAAIERRTGARQTYHRKPSEPGRVLAWELTDDER